MLNLSLVSLISFVLKHTYTDSVNLMEVSVYDGLMLSFVLFSIIAGFASWKMECTEEPEGEMYANRLDQLLLEMWFLNKWHYTTC